MDILHIKIDGNHRKTKFPKILISFNIINSLFEPNFHIILGFWSIFTHFESVWSDFDRFTCIWYMLYIKIDRNHRKTKSYKILINFNVIKSFFKRYFYIILWFWFIFTHFESVWSDFDRFTCIWYILYIKIDANHRKLSFTRF